MGNEHHCQQQDEGVGDGTAAGQRQEALLEAHHGPRIGVGERRAAHHHHHRERRDEGIDAEPGHQRAAERAGDSAASAAPAIAAGKPREEHDPGDAAHRQDGSDREIEAAGDHDDGHADDDDSIHRDGFEQRAQIGQRPEALDEERQARAAGAAA